MMNILVTGGSGFIGSNLVGVLLEAGHNVTIYDKRVSDSFQDICIIGDVRDKVALAKACNKIDIVYHLAAEHADDVSPTSLYFDVNVGGAGNLVAACALNGVNKLIFTSSVALYGLNVGIPTEKNPIQPFNEYGKSKYEAEKVFEKWAQKDSRRSLTMVRPVVIFGENNRGNVYNLLQQIAKGKFLMVGDGNNRKSMGYVKNIVEFLAHIADIGPGIHIYNYADKPDLTTKELVATVCETMGTPPTQFAIPYWLGLCGGVVFDLVSRITGKKFPISVIRIKKFCADTQVAADRFKDTGFQPRYSLEEGLKRMVELEFLSNKLPPGIAGRS